MLDPRDPEISVETTLGDRPRSSAGDRLMVGLAVLALVGGGLIGLSKLLPSEAAADASATPRPSVNGRATPAPTDAAALPRTYTVTYSPPRNDVALVGPVTGWIRARQRISVRVDPRVDAAASGTLQPGDAAFVVDDQLTGPSGWIQVVAPVHGWLRARTILGGDVQRFFQHPLDQPSALPDQVVAGPDGQFLMGTWLPGSGGYGLGVTNGGNAWRPTDPPRGTAYVRAAYGPHGWIAFAVGNATDRPRAWLWQSDDGIGWSSLGDASALLPGDQLGTLQLVGSARGYVMSPAFNGLGHPLGPQIWFSSDGVSWSEKGLPLAPDALATAGIGFYAYTTNLDERRVAAFSPDGQAWSEVDTTNLGQLLGVAGAGDHFVALERVGSIAYGWTARLEDGELVWRRGSRSEPAFRGAAVTAVSGSEVPIAVGWERGPETPLWWSYDGAGWHRHRLPASFEGLPRVAAASRAGYVVVGSGGGALHRDPVVWASDAGGNLQPERTPYLASYDTFDLRACAAYSGDLLDLLANQGIGYPECLGTRPIAVRAYLLPCEGCTGSGQSPSTADARWLAEPGEGRTLRLSPVDAANFGWFEGVLHPGVKAQGRWTGHWATVIGHFDDPAAQSCQLPPAPEEESWYGGRAQVVANCRGRFVVTDVRVER